MLEKNAFFFNRWRNFYIIMYIRAFLTQMCYIIESLYNNLLHHFKLFKIHGDRKNYFSYSTCCWSLCCPGAEIFNVKSDLKYALPYSKCKNNLPNLPLVIDKTFKVKKLLCLSETESILDFFDLFCHLIKAISKMKTFLWILLIIQSRWFSKKIFKADVFLGFLI